MSLQPSRVCKILKNEKRMVFNVIKKNGLQLNADYVFESIEVTVHFV